MLGLAGAGKKTLLRLMTGLTVQSVPPKGVAGVFPVRDPRVDALSLLYKPEKTTYARMDILLLPDLEKSQGKAAWLDEVRNLDGIVVVARDDGPGIPDLAQAMQDGYSTSRGLGLGLPGAKRLMDEFEIISHPGKGTTIVMKKWGRQRG